MQEKVTIIIPVFNVEQYLVRCLETVIKQTYENIEIIIVDDGSTDNSGKMCDDYALKDSRICVIHQKNAGLSAARNTALEIMHGDYVMFVDSDDTVDEHIVEYLLDDAHKYNCDIVECNFYDVFGDRVQGRNSLEKTDIHSIEEAMCIDIGTRGGSVLSLIHI